MLSAAKLPPSGQYKMRRASHASPSMQQSELRDLSDVSLCDLYMPFVIVGSALVVSATKLEFQRWKQSRGTDLYFVGNGSLQLSHVLRCPSAM